MEGSGWPFNVQVNHPMTLQRQDLVLGPASNKLNALVLNVLSVDL